MNKPRVLLPLVLSSLVLAAALATAAAVNAADDPCRPAGDPTIAQAELDALFDIAPLTGNMRARLAQTDPEAALLQAELDAMFAVAPAPVAKPPAPDRDLPREERDPMLQAEVDAMFAVAPAAKAVAPAREARSEKGRAVYLGLCFACHLPDGKGVANAIPPLAASDYLLADRDRAIAIVLRGLVGPIMVNGIPYNSAMPPLETTLSEEQIAHVLTYVTGEWGNNGTPSSVEDVRRVKQGTVRLAAP